MAFVGCVISVSIKNYSLTYASVGGTHCQGVVIHVDPGNQAITLSQPFVDGIPGKDHSITLSASDIADLKILKTAEETRSYVPLNSGQPIVENGNNDPIRKDSYTQSKQVQIIRKDSQSHDPVEFKRLQSGLEVLGYRKAPIHEPISQSPYMETVEEQTNSRQSKSKGSQNQRAGHSFNAGSISDSELQHNSNHNSRPQHNGRGRINTPKKTDYYKGGQQRRREDEICFGFDVDAIIGEEFDFERSNQMFDKEAVMEEITAEQRGYALNKSTGNDTSRQQPSTQNLQRHEVPEAKYRHDENILGTPSPAIYRQIKVKSDADGEEISRTDSGLVVPCINRKLQVKILTFAVKHGFSEERQMEAAGRSACEMLLQLVGGSHRLSPQNSHQTPSVVVLCGSGPSGDQDTSSLIIDSPSTIGLAIARNLANHCCRVVVCVPQKLIDTRLKKPLFATEMKLLKMTDAKVVHSINDLPSTPTDVIVSALDSETGKPSDDWSKNVTLWANQNKAPVLAVDPTGLATSHPASDPLQVKWSLQFVLPLTSTKKKVDDPSSANPNSSSQLYLCDLAIPRKVFREAGIQYQSPFGAKSFIALHRD